MEVNVSGEILVTIFQTTRCHNLKDNNLVLRISEKPLVQNLKCFAPKNVFDENWLNVVLVDNILTFIALCGFGT